MRFNRSANAFRWATVLSSYLAPAMLVASMTVAQDVGIICFSEVTTDACTKIGAERSVTCGDGRRCKHETVVNDPVKEAIETPTGRTSPRTEVDNLKRCYLRLWVCTETGCRPTSNHYDAFTPNQIVEGFGCGG